MYLMFPPSPDPEPPSAPVNLTAHHYNDSVLTLTWDPPLDQGGRQEVMYQVKCEREVEAGAPWEACGDGVMVLPSASGLNSTSVSIAGVNPQCGYRLSVQALNDISRLQGALQASTATVTIHRCTFLFFFYTATTCPVCITHLIRVWPVGPSRPMGVK